MSRTQTNDYLAANLNVAMPVPHKRYPTAIANPVLDLDEIFDDVTIRQLVDDNSIDAELYSFACDLAESRMRKPYAANELSFGETQRPKSGWERGQKPCGKLVARDRHRRRVALKLFSGGNSVGNGNLIVATVWVVIKWQEISKNNRNRNRGMTMDEQWGSSSGPQYRDEESWSESPRPAKPWPLIGLGALLVVIVVAGYLVLKSDSDEGSGGSDNLVASEGSLQSQPADAAATGASPSVAPSASADASAPSATAVSPADATATTIGGDPSTEGAWRYVVQPDDFPVAVADRFMLKSWRDIYALNGWTTLEEFPNPGTEILLPPSTLGTSGQPCNESTVLQELSASDADFERLRNLMQSGEIWISSFECGAGRGRGIDSNYAGFDFTSNTPYACFPAGSPGDSYPCGAPGPDDGYDCDRPPGEQALDQEIVCYSPDGESSSAERVNGRWAYLGSSSAGLWCDDFRGREAREELCE